MDARAGREMPASERVALRVLGEVDALVERLGAAY